MKWKVQWAQKYMSNGLTVSQAYSPPQPGALLAKEEEEEVVVVG